MTARLFGFICHHGGRLWRVAITALAITSSGAVARAENPWPQWNPIPGPAGGNPAGDFEYRVAKDDTDGRPFIEFRFKPKQGGVACAKTAIVQTYHQRFIDDAGQPEPLAKPSDLIPGDAPNANVLRKKPRESVDPDTVNGEVVDHGWSDADPYYNGDDPQDHPKNLDDPPGDAQGTAQRPTSIADAPQSGAGNFSGKRTKLVIDFEVCAYCKNDDGTLGQALGCITWTYEQGKTPPGKITAPTGSTATPSKPHADAAKKFVERHTRSPNGVVEKFCPEFEEVMARVARLSKQAENPELRPEDKELLRKEAERLRREAEAMRKGENP
jgi:hypothetical protein